MSFQVNKKKEVTIAFIVITLLILFILNLYLGSVIIPFKELKMLVFNYDSAKINVANIVLKTRLPQAITAALAGAGLAVSGIQLQTLFRNPLADPSILGISSGAGLGVAILIMLSGSLTGFFIASIGWIGQIAITLAAFSGASIVLFLILNFARKINNNAILLIIGIMIGFASGAIIDILRFFSAKEEVYAYMIWGMGSFSNVSNDQMGFYATMVIVGLIWSLLLIKPLNIMYLGENYGTNLGLNTRHVRFLILANTGLLTAVITAYCGPISFIGLAVPHIARGLMKTSNHGMLIPGTITIGASLALICNLIARMPAVDGTLPINSVTAIIGAPVVVWVLMKKNKEMIY